MTNEILVFVAVGLPLVILFTTIDRCEVAISWVAVVFVVFFGVGQTIFHSLQDGQWLMRLKIVCPALGLAVIPWLISRAINSIFVPYHQTPEGKMRAEAERENRERDELKQLTEKYEHTGDHP